MIVPTLWVWTNDLFMWLWKQGIWRYAKITTSVKVKWSSRVSENFLPPWNKPSCQRLESSCWSNADCNKKNNQELYSRVKISLRARQRAALGNCIAELKLRCSRCNSWILSISLCVEMTMGFWYLRAFGPHPQLHIWNQMTLLNKSIIAKQSSFFFLLYLKCHGYCVCAMSEFFSIPKWNDYASVLVPLARGDSPRKLHWEMIHLIAKFEKRSS